MIIALKIISFIGLGLTIIPSILVLTGHIDIPLHKQLMGVGMVLWFCGAYFWINRNNK